MAKAMGVKVGNASRKLVLLKLADNANDNGECWPSYQHVADQCEMSRRSVITHIDALIDQGLIVKTERKITSKLNQSNLYLLTLDNPQTTVNANSGSGEKSAPLGSEKPALGGEMVALGGEAVALGGGETVAPRTSHSLEPVIEPYNISAQDLRDDQQALSVSQPAKLKTRVTANDLITSFRVSEQIANEYLVVRGKTPLTPTALKVILKESEKLGWDLNQALTACCENGWRGFKANWIKNQQHSEGRHVAGQGDYTSSQASIDRLGDKSWAEPCSK